MALSQYSGHPGPAHRRERLDEEPLVTTAVRKLWKTVENCPLGPLTQNPCFVLSTKSVLRFLPNCDQFSPATLSQTPECLSKFKLCPYPSETLARCCCSNATLTWPEISVGFY